jgi:2-desacetyl-2-hydroxyethyl bacteriochlorophyllide A dehydrogenase
MRAILFTGKDQVSLTEIPIPRPGPGEVVVEVHASGICHTDIEVLRGNYGSSAFPVVPGHEYSGVVAEVGPNVDGLEIGGRVVVDPNLECGKCRACRRGWTHLCDALEAYGVTRQGGFAERSLVKSSRAHKIGDMPFEIAALAEPLGCVLNGLEAAQAKRARNALIFGAGPIGLLLAIGLKVSGVEDIALVDVNDARLELAESFGFQTVAAGSADITERRESADLAADATGAPAVAADLIRYIANGGAGLFFGVCPSDVHIKIAPFELFRRQITLAGSHSLNHNIPHALSALNSFGEDIARLVSHRLPIDEIAKVFDGEVPNKSLKIQGIKS